MQYAVAMATAAFLSVIVASGDSAVYAVVYGAGAGAAVTAGGAYYGAGVAAGALELQEVSAAVASAAPAAFVLVETLAAPAWSVVCLI
jgi:hypothetical protein